MEPCLTPVQIEAFVADAMADEARVKAEAHLQTCQRCRAAVEARRTETDLVGDIHQAYQAETVTKPQSPVGGAAAPSPPITDNIEGYEIVGEIHRGGQGVVYKAMQKATKRTVALKVLLQGPYASRRQRYRFEREIDLVASLQHPNIVTLYDSGVTPDGRHYFAMEYIHGQSLDEYLEKVKTSKSQKVKTSERQKVEIEDVLRLFSKICAAVNYAHQRGVIHRDLKPGNIRIDAKGEPHILDFGLAKAAGASLSDGLPVSLTGEFMGTLAYASPEQTQGDPNLIDIRTDVYSLGVVLYEMLTGNYPYPVIGQMAEVLNNIADTEPKRPSTIRRQINDEVETIVLKALSKEKGRRYQSAENLARDIEHYLAGEPIDAKRDSAWYVIRKQLRRYKLPVAVAAAFILLLAGSTVALSLMYKDAEAARKAEAKQRHIADNKTQEAIAARDAAGEAEKKAIAARDEASAQRNQAEQARRNEEEQRRNADENARRAEEARNVADAKKAQLAKAMTEANLQKQIADKKTDEARAQAARADKNASQLEQRNAELQTQRQKEAEARKRAESAAKKLRKEVDMAASVRHFIESAMIFSGKNAKNAKQNRRAFALALEDAAKGLDEQFAEQPGLAVVFHNIMARTYQKLHEYEKARVHADRALTLSRKQLGPYHPETIAAMCMVADVLKERGQYEESRHMIEDAYHSCKNAHISEANPQRLRAELLFARLQFEEGHNAKASILLEHVRSTRRRLFGVRNTETLDAMLSAWMNADIGSLFFGHSTPQSSSSLDSITVAEVRNQRNICALLFGDDDEQTLLLNLGVAALMVVRNINGNTASQLNIDINHSDASSVSRSINSAIGLPENILRQVEELVSVTRRLAHQRYGWRSPVTLTAELAWAAVRFVRKDYLAAFGIVTSLPRDLGDRLSQGPSLDISLNLLALVGLGLSYADDVPFLRPLGWGKKGRRYSSDAVRLADSLLPPWGKTRIETRMVAASFLREHHQTDAALKLLTEGEQIAADNDRNTDQIDVMLNLSWLYQDMKQKDDRQRILEKALQIVSDHKLSSLEAKVRLQLADALEGKQAEEQLRLAIQAAKTSKQAEYLHRGYSALSKLLLENGRFREAEALLLVATSRKITSLEILEDLSRAYLGQDRTRDARKPLLKALRLAEKSKWQRDKIIELFRSTYHPYGRYEEAETFLLHEIEQPENASIRPQIRNLLSHLYSDWGKPEKASEFKDEVKGK